MQPWTKNRFITVTQAAELRGVTRQAADPERAASGREGREPVAARPAPSGTVRRARRGTAPGLVTAGGLIGRHFMGKFAGIPARTDYQQ
jgi:hypothetical protein